MPRFLFVTLLVGLVLTFTGGAFVASARRSSDYVCIRTHDFAGQPITETLYDLKTAVYQQDLRRHAPPLSPTSPDGQHTVHAWTNPDRTFRLYLTRAADGYTKLLTARSLGTRGLPGRDSAAFAPNNSQFALIYTYANEPYEQYHLIVVNLQTYALTDVPLVLPDGAAPTQVRLLGWSADGQYLGLAAASSWTANPHFYFWIAAEERLMMGDPAAIPHDRDPTWSPTGHLMAARLSTSTGAAILSPAEGILSRTAPDMTFEFLQWHTNGRALSAIYSDASGLKALVLDADTPNTLQAPHSAPEGYFASSDGYFFFQQQHNGAYQVFMAALPFKQLQRLPFPETPDRYQIRVFMPNYHIWQSGSDYYLFRAADAKVTPLGQFDILSTAGWLESLQAIFYVVYRDEQWIVGVFDPATEQHSVALTLHEGIRQTAPRAVVAPNGQHAVVLTDEGLLIGDAVSTYNIGQSALTGLVWSPDSQYIARPVQLLGAPIRYVIQVVNTQGQVVQTLPPQLNLGSLAWSTCD